MADFRLLEDGTSKRLLEDGTSFRLLEHGAYAALVLSLSPVAYWRLGEASGTQAVAAIGPHGTYVGSPTLGAAGALTGDTNTGVTFDGSTEYITVPDDAALDLGDGPLSYLLCWKRATDVDQRIISKGTNAPYLFYDQATDKLDAGAGGSGSGVEQSTTIADANWHFIVVTKTNTDAWKLYIDGVDRTGTNAALSTASTTAQLVIGAREDFSNKVNGSLDEVAFFASVLTSTNVSDLYAAATSAGVTVTGTATWDQAPAAWSATGTEQFKATGAWTQAPAAWSADGIAVNPVTGTATFTQEAAAWDATALAANPVSATATWEQTAAWAATATESIPASATFEQTASWDAVVTESIPSTATWLQDAQWAALGLNAEDVLADATWEQSAASWLAASSQVITGSGTWEQVNTWLAAVVEAFTAAATWEQSATWEASADVDNPAVTGTGAWTQTATWAGLASTPSTAPSTSGGGFRLPRRRRSTSNLLDLPEPVAAFASFTQAPAAWHADMNVARSRQERDIEELLLMGIL